MFSKQFKDEWGSTRVLLIAKLMKSKFLNCLDTKMLKIKITLSLFSLLLALPAMAQLASKFEVSDWEFVFENQLVKFYYGPRYITVKGSYLEVMTMSDRIEPDDRGTKSSFYIYEFSCRLTASRLTYVEDYSDHRLQGKLISSVTNPDKRLYATPPSLLDFQRTICRPF